MLFDRYAEVLERLEELGGKMGKLNNRDRQVMQNLLEEQEWLSSTLVKRARFLLEEIDRNFEKLFDWMISFSDLIDRAAGQGGTPSDVLRMESMVHEAEELREQLNRLVPDQGRFEDVPTVLGQEAPLSEAPHGCVPDSKSAAGGAGAAAEARREAAPAAGQEAGTGYALPPFAVPLLNQPEKLRKVLPSPVVKKTRKKDRQKNKSGGGQAKYVPPRELLSELERKMAAASLKPQKTEGINIPPYRFTDVSINQFNPDTAAERPLKPL